MNNRKVQIGAIIALIGIFFAVTSYLSIQEMEGNIFVESNSYTSGISLLNRYVMGIGILMSIFGTGYSVIGLYVDKKIDKSLEKS